MTKKQKNGISQYEIKQEVCTDEKGTKTPKKERRYYLIKMKEVGVSTWNNRRLVKQ